MELDYWYKQTTEKPLFPDILWSRPENRHSAGKLLIIGGNAQSLAAPAEAYQSAAAAGIGTAKVILPDALQKTIGRVLEDADYAPSSPSGSFSKQALAAWLDGASWADGVLLAGDLGRNSETAIAVESLLKHYSGQLTVTKDAVDYLTSIPQVLSERTNTTLVLSLSQLQRLGTALHFERPFLLSMGVLLLTQALHEFTKLHPFIIVTRELDTLIVAFKGRVSTTKTIENEDVWRVKTAARTSVFWLQNSNRPFEAITSALYTQP